MLYVAEDITVEAWSLKKLGSSTYVSLPLHREEGCPVLPW